MSRITPIPKNWTQLDFDDSRWDYALEYTDEEVKWGLPPANCTVPGNIISSETDPQGNPITCPQNLDWGNSKFIWGTNLDLENWLLCRYTVKLESGAYLLKSSIAVVLLASLVILMLI